MDDLIVVTNDQIVVTYSSLMLLTGISMILFNESSKSYIFVSLIIISLNPQPCFLFPHDKELVREVEEALVVGDPEPQCQVRRGSGLQTK